MGITQYKLEIDDAQSLAFSILLMILPFTIKGEGSIHLEGLFGLITLIIFTCFLFIYAFVLIYLLTNSFTITKYR